MQHAKQQHNEKPLSNEELTRRLKALEDKIDVLSLAEQLRQALRRIAALEGK